MKVPIALACETRNLTRTNTVARLGGNHRSPSHLAVGQMARHEAQNGRQRRSKRTDNQSVQADGL